MTRLSSNGAWKHQLTANKKYQLILLLERWLFYVVIFVCKGNSVWKESFLYVCCLPLCHCVCYYSSENFTWCHRKQSFRLVFFHDFSWFEDFFLYKSPFASMFSWKKKEVACIVFKPLVSCLLGCGESVNPPKLNIQEVQGRPRPATLLFGFFTFVKSHPWVFTEGVCQFISYCLSRFSFGNLCLFSSVCRVVYTFVFLKLCFMCSCCLLNCLAVVLQQIYHQDLLQKSKMWQCFRNKAMMLRVWL